MMKIPNFKVNKIHAFLFSYSALDLAGECLLIECDFFIL